LHSRLDRIRSARERLELSSASATPSFSVVLLIGVLGLQLAMIGSYVGALHAPEPRDLAVARARTAASIAELNAAIDAGERDYRALRARLEDFDRRLEAVASRLRRPGEPDPSPDPPPARAANSPLTSLGDREASPGRTRRRRRRGVRGVGARASAFTR